MSERISRVTGHSMVPTLVEPMIVETIQQERYCIGDVVVYQGEEPGKTVVHRIVKITPGGYITRGDNNTCDDPPILKADVLGKVVTASRGRKQKKILNGRSGYLLHNLLKMRRRWRPGLIRLLSFPYHVLSDAKIFYKICPPAYRPRIIYYRDKPPHLCMGNRLIGWYDDEYGQWVIRRPWRLLVDEDSLPSVTGNLKDK